MKGVVSATTAGFNTLVAIILRLCASRHDKLAFSNWTSPTLSDDQKLYAAQNAYANLQIWLYLSTEKSVGLPVERAVTGEKVSLMSGKKIAAYGTLADQPHKMTVPAHLSVTLYRKVRNTRFYILPLLACQRTPADGK